MMATAVKQNTTGSQLMQDDSTPENKGYEAVVHFVKKQAAVDKWAGHPDTDLIIPCICCDILA